MNAKSDGSFDTPGDVVPLVTQPIIDYLKRKNGQLIALIMLHGDLRRSEKAPVALRSRWMIVNQNGIG